MTRSKIIQLLVCATLLVSLVSCKGEIKITSKKLFGKSNIDLGKPISLSSQTIPRSIYHSLTQRGDEILFSVPKTKENKGIFTSKSYKIKGEIYKLFYLDITASKTLVWMTSSSDSKYFLYCFLLIYGTHQKSCQLEKVFEVATDTPRIVTTFGSFDTGLSNVSNNQDFIICQSINFDKIVYYNLRGEILNEYSIGKIALSKTGWHYDNLFGFDGKNIYSMSPIMTNKTRIVITSRYQSLLNLDLQSTDFWFNEDLFFLYKTNLYIAQTNSINTDKPITCMTFNDIQGFNFFRYELYVEKSDGIYTLTYDPARWEYVLNQVYISHYKYYISQFDSNLKDYLVVTEEIDNKYRFVIISKDNYGNNQKYYSDSLETNKMPIWYDTGYYYNAMYYNADGVWLTNSSDVLNQ